MSICQGCGGGALFLVWGCSWAILRPLRAGGKAVAPCAASALGRALVLPTCPSAACARRSRERLPSTRLFAKL